MSIGGVLASACCCDGSPSCSTCADLVHVVSGLSWTASLKAECTYAPTGQYTGYETASCLVAFPDSVVATLENPTLCTWYGVSDWVAGTSEAIQCPEYAIECGESGYVQSIVRGRVRVFITQQVASGSPPFWRVVVWYDFEITAQAYPSRWLGWSSGLTIERWFDSTGAAYCPSDAGDYLEDTDPFSPNYSPVEGDIAASVGQDGCGFGPIFSFASDASLPVEIEVTA